MRAIRASRTALVLAVLATPAALSARAADLTSVDQLYFHRNEGKNLEEHIAGLNALLKASPDDPELLWRKGRALVRRGETKKLAADRVADFLAAEDSLKRALKRAPSDAETHFWLGVAMGRRGETQGIVKSLFLLKPIRAEMRETLRLDPKHGGAHRLQGEILWQVPALFGGDKKQALREFQLAVELSPDYSTNYKPLAEAYLHFGRKNDAVSVLKRVETIKTPADPAEYPDDLADARALLKNLGR